MKIKILLLCLLTMVFPIHSYQVYLWESLQNGERSCCLSLTADFCNYGVPCTKNVYSDLAGIYNYVTRVLTASKGNSFSYTKLLLQAQYYLRHALSHSLVQLNYKRDVYREVVFFHEASDMLANKTPDKSAKASSPSTATSSATDKAKADDVIWRYMVKLGLARPHKK